MDLLRRQYESVPYPYVPLPARLRFIPGVSPEIRFDTIAERSSRGIEILVLGAGTTEALYIASLHPHARRVTAVDFSKASLRRLEARIRWHQALRVFRGRIAPIETIHADLMQWDPGNFRWDYIVASHVLHHLPNPWDAPSRIARWLKPEGLLRVSTYPLQSRHWMRATSRYLAERLIMNTEAALSAPKLTQRAREAIRQLPESDPVRSCFESQPETRSRAGLIDAFWNARENALAPLQWRAAFAKAGLILTAESHTFTSTSAFALELVPETSQLDAWGRLQVLDDTLELCANPVLWLKPINEELFKAELTEPFQATSLREGLLRADRLLRACGSSARTWMQALERDVGPRFSAPPRERHLPGLSLLDHPWREWLGSIGA